MGGEGSGRKREPKDARPYRATSTSGKQFSNLITNSKPPNMPVIKEDPLAVTQAEIKKAINDKIENWALINKAQMAHMPPDVIREMKMQMGISDENKVNVENQNQMQTNAMLMQMFNATDDQNMKNLIMMAVSNQGSDKNNVIAQLMPQMMMMQTKNQNKDESFTEKLALKFIEGKTDNKSDIEKAMEFYTQMNKMQETIKPKDALDSILESKTKLMELGLVQDPAGSIEDRKIDLEFEKLKLDHELVIAQTDAKTAGQEEIMKSVSNGVTALLGALGHYAGQKGESQAEINQQEETNDQITNSGGKRIMVECSNPKCNTQFPVVTDKDRDIKCPNGNCNFTYLVKSGQFYVSPESENLLENITTSGSDESKEQKEVKLE